MSLNKYETLLQEHAAELDDRRIENTKRLIEEKAQQLKSISGTAVIITGFSAMFFIEVEIPADTLTSLVAVYGFNCNLVVMLMLIPLVIATYILVIIMKFDAKQTHTRFEDFWQQKCESDWNVAMRSFSYAVPAFLVNTALLAWVVFDRFYIGSILTTSVALFAAFVFLLRVHNKWGSFIYRSYKMNLDTVNNDAHTLEVQHGSL